jgi:hypothetical protein
MHYFVIVLAILVAAAVFSGNFRWVAIPALICAAIFCLFIGGAAPNTHFMTWVGVGCVIIILRLID